MTWITDKSWADCWRPQIERELRPVVGDIVELIDSTTEQDRTEGFDYLIVTKLGNVACRLRRPTPYRDVTIRSRRDSGATTEIDKLRDGHANLYFYGWTAESSPTFADFVIFHVDRFLAAGLIERHARDIPNGDGTYFRAVPSTELFSVAGCVLRSSPTLLPPLEPDGQLSLFHSAGRR